MKYKHGVLFYISVALFCIVFAPVVLAIAAGRLVYSLAMGQAVTNVVSASRPESRDELDAETDYLHDARKKALLSAVLSGVLLFALLSIPTFVSIRSHAEVKRAAQLAAISASVSESVPEPSSLSAPESVPEPSPEPSEEVVVSSSPSSETSEDESSAESEELSAPDESAVTEPSSEPAESTDSVSDESAVSEESAVPVLEESSEESSEEVYEGLTIESFWGLAPNCDASVYVQGKPNTSYSITVRYASGNSTAKGVTGENRTKISDDNGRVSWGWRVGPKTRSGSAVTVTMSGGGETASVSDTVG